MKRGPLEQAAWDTLPNRPAAIYSAASQKAQDCFAGIFNGCKSRGVIFVPERDELSIGKYECERDWRETWGELKAAGLIDWREEDVPCHDGSKMIHVHLTVTDKGHEVRKDDLKWYNEVMNARRADEAAA